MLALFCLIATGIEDKEMSGIFDQLGLGVNRQKGLGELPGDLNFARSDLYGAVDPQFPDISQRQALLAPMNLPTGQMGEGVPKMATFVQSTFDTRPINSQEFINRGVALPFEPTNITIGSTAVADQNIPEVAGNFTHPESEPLFINGRVYTFIDVNNTGSAYINVTNADTGALITTIPLVNFRHANDSQHGRQTLAYAPNANRLYVIGQSSLTFFTQIKSINLATNVVTLLYDFFSNYRSVAIVYNPFDGLVYEGNNYSSAGAMVPSVTVINPVTDSVISTFDAIFASNRMEFLAPVSAGKLITMAGNASDDLTTFDYPAGTFTQYTTGINSTAASGWANYPGTSNFVLTGGGSIIYMDVVTNQIFTVITPTDNPGVEDVQYNPVTGTFGILLNGGTVYGDYVVIFDPATLTISEPIEVDFTGALDARGLQVNAAIGNYYAFSGSRDIVVVIDGVSNQKFYTITFQAGANPAYSVSALSANPTGDRVYIARSGFTADDSYLTTIKFDAVKYKSTTKMTVPDGQVMVLRDFRYQTEPLLNLDYNDIIARFDVDGAFVPNHDDMHLGPVLVKPETTHLLAGPNQVLTLTIEVQGAAAAPSSVNTILHGEFLQSRGLPVNYEVGSL